jgi:hypothetical protein
MWVGVPVFDDIVNFNSGAKGILPPGQPPHPCKIRSIFLLAKSIPFNGLCIAIATTMPGRGVMNKKGLGGKHIRGFGISIAIAMVCQNNLTYCMLYDVNRGEYCPHVAMVWFLQ